MTTEINQKEWRVLEALVYEDSYSWKKSDNFFIEWYSNSSKIRHKDMMMESFSVVTVKVDFGHEINQHQKRTLQFSDYQDFNA